MWVRYLDKKNKQYEESRGIVDPYTVLKEDRKKALRESATDKKRIAANRKKAKDIRRMYGREIRGMSERERKALRQRSAWAERTEYMEHFNETMRANQSVGISASNLRDKVAERQRVAAGRDKQRRPGGWA